MRSTKDLKDIVQGVRARSKNVKSTVETEANMSTADDDDPHSKTNPYEKKKSSLLMNGPDGLGATGDEKLMVVKL